jgi:geranylgeranyl reductase family protein
LTFAVVGAGPAGTAAAITAVEHGLRVVCIDKARFPRDKTCGDGLTAYALRLLEQLGLTIDEFRATDAEVVHDMVLVGPNGTRSLMPLPTNGVYAAVAKRRDLDAALVALVRRRGVEVREGCGVERVTPEADCVRLDDFAARYVIAADGQWSAVRGALNPDAPRDLGMWHAVRQHHEDVSADCLWVIFERDLLPGYAWVFPLGGGRANVGYGVLRSDGRSGRELKALWPDLLARPVLRDALGPNAAATEPVRAWPIPSRFAPERLQQGRVLFAGDAANVVDPMTGEGIGQAIETGMLAAKAIATDKSYRRLVHRAIGRDLRFASFSQRALSSPRRAAANVRAIDLTARTRASFARWLWEGYPRALLLTPDRWHRHMFSAPGAGPDAAVS